MQVRKPSAADEGCCDAALIPEQHLKLTVLIEMKMKTSIYVQSQRAACKRSLSKRD